MKRLISLCLIILVLCSATACTASTNINSRTITDSAGDEVMIPQNVSSIINLVTYGVQVMIGLDLGDSLIGIHNEAIESAWIIEMYPRVKSIKTYSQEESAESLLLSGVDVVMVEDAEYARSLRSKGVTAITFTYYSIDEYRLAIAMLGELLGEKAIKKCSLYLEYLDRNIELISASLGETIKKKETLYYINGVSSKGLYKTTGRGSTNHSCAELSFVDFATADLIESPENKVDSEAILAANPENIIIGGVYQHVLKKELLAKSEWKNNTAVKNGNIFTVPMGISAWNRYGIEIAIMIPWTTAMVYPEYFKFDVVNETIKFYSMFTGYKLTEQQAMYIIDGLTPTGEKEIAN